MLTNVKHVNAGFALVLPWKKLNGLRGKLFNLQNSICHIVTIVTSAEILRKSAILRDNLGQFYTQEGSRLLHTSSDLASGRTVSPDEPLP